MNNIVVYLSILKKHLLLILIITLLSTLTSIISVFFLTKPIYVSNISIIIGQNPSESVNKINQYTYDVVMYQKMVKTYSELITSRIVLEDVIKKTNLKINTDSLANMIKIKTTTESEFIDITVECTDAQSTALIANQLVSSLKEISSSIRGVDNVVLVDSALIPELPTKPNKVVNISLAFVVAFIFSILICILLDYFDQRINDKNQMKELSLFPILGELPPLFNLNDNNETNYLFANTLPKSPPLEALNILRTNLQFCNVNSKQKVILITSSVPKEGKSSITSNLAISMALTNKKVIIIDCDMRTPSIHTIFSIDNTIGLSHILSNQAELEECIQVSKIDNLSILTAGTTPPNPSELISSNKLDIIFERLSLTYDIILIDSPPILSIADAQVLSTLVDGTILVTRLQYTRKTDLITTKEILDSLKSKVIGLVINNSK